MKIFIKSILVILLTLQNAGSIENNTARLMVNQLPDNVPDTMILSSDKQYYLTMTDNRYAIVSSSTGKILVSSAISSRGHTGTSVPVNGISHNLEKMAYVDDQTKSIMVINLFTGERIANFKPEDSTGKYKYTTDIAVSSDGKMIILFGVKSGITIYRSEDAQKYTLSDHYPYDNFNQTNLVSISPNDRYLAMSIADDPGALMVFDLLERKKLFKKGSGGFFSSGHEDYLRTLYFSENSKFLLSADIGKKVFVHDLKGDSKKIENTLRNIFNAEISETGEVKICPERFEIGFCTPSKIVPPQAKLLRKYSLFDLAGIVYPSILKYTQSEAAEEYLGDSSMRRAIKNTTTKRAVTRDTFLGEGKSKFTLYDSSASAFTEIQNFEIAGDWAVGHRTDKKVIIADFMLTDKNLILMSNVSRKMKGYDFSGKEVLSCKEGDLPLSFFQLHDYFPGKDLALVADRSYILLYSNNCQNLVQAHEESGSIEEIRFTNSGEFIVIRTGSGVIRIRDTKTLNIVASVVWGGPESWAVAAADGRYDGKGDALASLHYVTGREVIQLPDFDKSFFTPGLIYTIFGEKNPFKKPEVAPLVKVEVKKSLAGKIHSILGSEITVSGSSIKMGEKLFAVVNGKKIYLKVHFPTHSGAKTKAAKTSELSQLAKGMPVFR